MAGEGQLIQGVTILWVTINILSVTDCAHFTVAASKDISIGCPVGWAAHLTSCYLVGGLAETRPTHGDAGQKCRLAGAKLAVIDTNSTGNFLANYIREVVVYSHRSVLSGALAVWIDTWPGELEPGPIQGRAECSILDAGVLTLERTSCTARRPYICQMPRASKHLDHMIQRKPSQRSSVRENQRHRVKQVLSVGDETPRVYLGTEPRKDTSRRNQSETSSILVWRRRLLSVANITTIMPEETTGLLHDTLSTFTESIRQLSETNSLLQLEQSVGNLNNFVRNNLEKVSEYLQWIQSEASSNTTRQSDIQEMAASLIRTTQNIGVILLRLLTTTQSYVNEGAIEMLVAKSRYEDFEGFVFETKQSGREWSVTVPKHAGLDGMGGLVAFSLPELGPLLADDKDGATLTSPMATCSMWTVAGQQIVSTLHPISIWFRNGAPAALSGNQQVSCRYLTLTGAGLHGGWSEDGCTLEKHMGTEVVCKCNQLTAFGVHLRPTTLMDSVPYMSLVGCAFTTVCCLVATMTIIGYGLLDSTRSYVRVSFLVALTVTEALFLTGIRFSEVPAVCVIVAVLLHFSCLASFTWLLSYSLFLGTEMRMTNPYNRIMTVHMYTAIGWGIPAMLAIITIIWRNADYRDPFFCWVSSGNFMYFVLLIPMVLTVMVTWGILFMVLHIYRKMKDIAAKTLVAVTWSGIRSCLILNPLLAATWLSAAFTIIFRATWIQVLFAVLNIALGIAVFLFMCFWNEEVRIARAPKKSVPPTTDTRVFQSSKVEPLGSCCRLEDGLDVHSNACRHTRREPPSKFTSIWMVGSSDTKRETGDTISSDTKRKESESKGLPYTRSDSKAALIQGDEHGDKEDSESTF